MKYTDQLVSKIKEEYPLLYAYVMHGYKENASFVSVLEHRYQQSTPTLNLAKLMNELKDKYPHHFIWVQDPDPYQIIIDGLRAEQMEQAMDLDQTNRYATNIQNRISKSIATLAVLDQHEHQLKTQERVPDQVKIARWQKQSRPKRLSRLVGVVGDGSLTTILQNELSKYLFYCWADDSVSPT